jgi:hypothetical protein
MRYTVLSILLIFLLSWSIRVSAQADCDQTSTGHIPINDLGTETYLGMMGGLYPNGSNFRPEEHLQAGLQRAQQVQPLDANGDPDPVNGKVVLITIGFSNAAQESQAFIPMAMAHPGIHPQLAIVNGAQGGQTTTILSTPTDPGYAAYWALVGDRLANAGVTHAQVQAIWFKDSNQANGASIDVFADTLYDQCVRIMHELNGRFPNAHLCYIASRIYGGYATGQLNPEPYAYRHGWVMKQLIEAQINGDPQLEHEGSTPNSPWLSWGTYLWADGIVPRSDGLTWICPDDFASDGVHPSAIGREKVAGLLLDHFTTDSTSCPWFLENCDLSTSIEAAVGGRSYCHYDPVNERLYVHHDLQGPLQLRVFDSLGRSVISMMSNGDPLSISAHALRPGVHMILGEDGNGREIRATFIKFR